MVQALTGEKREEFGSNKRQIASDDDGPLRFARNERSVKTAEGTPLRINVCHTRELRSQPADERHLVSDLQQRFGNALGKRLAFNQQLRFISSHSAGGAAGEDKGFHTGGIIL